MADQQYPGLPEYINRVEGLINSMESPREKQLMKLHFMLVKSQFMRNESNLVQNLASNVSLYHTLTYLD
jgi:hypothetical protein